jgi:hypothetical protein
MSNKVIVYLACPYSHPDRTVRVARFEAVNRVASDLMRRGLKIFSPISHTHPIAEAGGLPLGWDYWYEYDLAFLSASNKLIVLMADGWKESTGVNGEIQIAETLGIEIEYMEPSERHYSPEEIEARASVDHENRIETASGRNGEQP